MKKNKGKIILILFCICLIALVVLVIIYDNLNNPKKPSEFKGDPQTGKGITPIVDQKEDDVLNISGFGVFFEKFTGDLTSSKIANKLDEITTTVLPEMFHEVKDYDEDEIEEYYTKNSKNIIDSFGIESAENFSKFITALKETNLDLNTWYRLDLLKETFNNESDKQNYAYAEYEVSFKNNQKIKFSLYVSKTSRVTPQYIIDIIK